MSANQTRAHYEAMAKEATLQNSIVDVRSILGATVRALNAEGRSDMAEELARVGFAFAHLADKANALADRICFECEEVRFGYQYSELRATLARTGASA